MSDIKYTKHRIQQSIKKKSSLINSSSLARRASGASHMIYEPKSVSDIGEQFAPQRNVGGHLFSQNKKGVAEVITTLLLTAIAVGAVLFAWSTIQPILNKADISKSPEYNCLQLQLETNLALQITKACYNSQTAQHEVTVKRSATQSTPVFEMIFTFHSTVPESSWRCSDICSAETGGCQVPDKGQAKTYFFTNDNPENLKSVKIYLGECELDTKTIVNC